VGGDVDIGGSRNPQAPSPELTIEQMFGTILP
jgi:hypothetical protein